MAASTVNIADFRYREMKGRPARSLQEAENPEGLRIVDPEGADYPSSDAASGMSSAENPMVMDIGAARESHHARRFVLRPALISRNRSNLIRFNEPHVTVMKVRQAHSIQSWADVADDYDHPPAA
jgi:hypothetical protein